MVRAAEQLLILVWLEPIRATAEATEEAAALAQAALVDILAMEEAAVLAQAAAAALATFFLAVVIFKCLAAVELVF